MRKLVSIQQIRDVVPIEGADAVELVLIMGWQCVAKKGEFKAQDFCVYFEVDSYLPIDPRYEFLRRTSYRNNEFNGEGFRIKTMSMRGALSQGLALPVLAFPEITSYAAGDDVTELLGVKKWEVPEMATGSGTHIGDKPFGIPTTDETRIQSMPELIEAFTDAPYYITTKMDGTSCTIYVKDGKVGVCGRNYEYSESSGDSPMWAWVHKHGIKEKMSALGENIAIQGEFCGGGIQKNRLKLTEPHLYVFDVIKLAGEGEWSTTLGWEGIVEYCGKLGLETVPCEETGESFSYTLDELLERAKGKYSSGMDKEGIVVRSLGYKYNPQLGHRMSFKVINNDFLKKEKD